MRRLAIILAVVLLSALGSASPAADLQAGSYAKINNFMVYYEGSFYGYPAGLTFQPGSYGPYEVSKPTGWDWTVSVPTATLGVPVGTSAYAREGLMLPGNATRVTFHYNTDYDANEMRLELVLMDLQLNPISVIWSQDLSGYQSASYDSYWREYVRAENQYLGLRVVAVPEPSTLLGLLVPALALLGMRMRSRR